MAKKTSEHSKNFYKVKDYYDGGYWTLDRVKRAVVKEWITADEYREITREVYEA